MIGADHWVWVNNSNNFLELITQNCPDFDNPQQINLVVYDCLIRNVIRAWKHQDEINESFAIRKVDGNAGKFAAHSLRILSCRSAEEFVTKARNLSTFADYPKYHPYVFDENDDEYQSLTKFVDDSIQSNPHPGF